MRIAFYAPMKPPTSRSPSGDRTIGRALIKALTMAGHDVRLASGLRTWSGQPGDAQLNRLRNAADAACRRLADAYGRAAESGNEAAWRPDLWFTYHSHYKAPDLVGPCIKRRLALPYVIAEASYSERRATGPWAAWSAAVAAGVRTADKIFCFTARDLDGLRPIARPGVAVRLAPFLDDAAFAGAHKTPVRGGAPVRLVTVAMMRPGAKEASYRLLAAALRLLAHDVEWTLDVVGDGALAGEMQRLLSDAAGARVRFHGALEPRGVADVLARSDVFVWPGIDEAFGMAYLEAQAHGLPVAACRTAGVPEVVRDGVTGLLARDTSPEALCDVVGELIAAGELRRRLGRQARAAIAARHSLSAASRSLATELAPLVAVE